MGALFVYVVLETLSVPQILHVVVQRGGPDFTMPLLALCLVIPTAKSQPKVSNRYVEASIPCDPPSLA